MDIFGLVIGIIALGIIGLGFPLVIQTEKFGGYLWWPYMLAVGILMAIGSLFVANIWISAVLGALGATFAWGSTELKEQAVRTEVGWYPFNGNKVRPPFAEIIEKWKAPHL